jgi:aminoglycoside phosphotransferase (APT) family kinase protein
MARCFRISLETVGDESAPSSLIAKFNSTDAETRKLAVDESCYAREIGFYRELAPRLPLSTPRCLLALIDDSKSEFTLLLEDMSPATQGDQIKGLSLATAEEAINELASMHAATWNDSALKSYKWMQSLTDLQEEYFRQQREVTPEFIKRLGNRLDPDIVDLINQMATRSDRLVDCLHEQPYALIHWDYRADNLLVNERVSPPRVTAVDWQTVMIGAPLQDVAYFIGASLKTDLRRENEQRLLKDYHQKLLQCGVRDFTAQQCYQGYQLGSFSGLTMAVRAAILVEETERGNEMFITMAKRHGKQVLDLEAQSLLE